MPETTRPERLVLAALTAMFLALLVVYSLVIPLFRSPDEAAHVDLTLLMSRSLDYPDYDERHIDDEVMRALPLAGWNVAAHREAEAALPRAERPTFDELDQGSPTRDRNQLTQHPPAYYALVGAWDRVGDWLPLPSWLDSFDGETWRLRLANVLLTSTLPFFVWWAGREAGLSRTASLAAATMPLAVPQVAAIGAAVNNDNLFVVLCAALFVPLLRIARREVGLGTHLWAGALIGVALFTKGFALTVPAWYVAAAAVGLWRRRRWRAATVGALAAGSLSLLIGGWWWVRNVLVHDRLQPSIQESRLAPRPLDFAPNYREFVHVFRTTIPRRFWGDFGSFDVHLPDGLTTALTVALLAALGYAVLRRPRSGPLRPGERFVLAVPIATLLFVLVGGALDSYRSTAQYAFQQGRYLFGALAAIVLLLASILPGRAVARPRLVVGSVLAVAGLLHGLALWTLLRHYWGAAGASIGERLDSVAAWSPFPAAVDGLVVVLVLVAVTATALAVARLPRDEAAQPA